MYPTLLKARIQKYDPIKCTALALKEELNTVNFGLENSLCLASDLSVALQTLKEKRPVLWLQFISEIFPGRKQEKQWLRRFDSIFQVSYVALDRG